MKTKQQLPKALREQVWLRTNKQTFKVKCPISWCNNKINVFDFHVGHMIPESKGGATRIDNLMPICAKCNLSMSNNYTITEFSNAFKEAMTYSIMRYTYLLIIFALLLYLVFHALLLYLVFHYILNSQA